MTQTITYDGGTALAGVVRRSTVRFTESARLGETGMGSFTIDDQAAAYDITGLKDLIADQSLASPTRIFTGYVADRHYRRGEVLSHVAAARETTVDVVDLNARLGFLVITGDDGDRDAETVGERMTWLLASGYLDLADTGWVVYPTTPMDASDYRGQTAGNVVSDCAVAVGYNYFARWSGSAAGLFFDDSNTSTVLSSTSRISNVAADVDGVTTHAPFDNAELTRSPETVESGMYVPYLRGSVYRTRAATAAEFAPRDGVAPSANVEDETTATTLGDRLLLEASTEEDTITCTIAVWPANVNDIRAGDRLEVKFSHFPGYEDWTWARVVQRTVTQPTDTDTRYQIDLILSGRPGTPPTCVGAVNVNALHGSVGGAVSLEAGTTLWAHATIPGWFGSPLDDPVSLIPVSRPSETNDGSVTSFSVSDAQNLRFDGSVALCWTSDLGATYSVCSHRGTSEYSGDSYRSYPPTTIDYSDDGVTWTSAEYTLTYDSSAVPRYWVATLTSAVEARYWRLRYAWTGHGGIANLWTSPGYNDLGTRVYDWQILADPDPV